MSQTVCLPGRVSVVWVDYCWLLLIIAGHASILFDSLSPAASQFVYQPCFRRWKGCDVRLEIGTSKSGPAKLWPGGREKLGVDWGWHDPKIVTTVDCVKTTGHIRDSGIFRCWSQSQSPEVLARSREGRSKSPQLWILLVLPYFHLPRKQERNQDLDDANPNKQPDSCVQPHDTAHIVHSRHSACRVACRSQPRPTFRHHSWLRTRYFMIVA